MKAEKLALTVLGFMVFAWAGRMITGIIELSRYQEVPLLAAGLEMSMFLGAGLIPLVGVWFFNVKRMRWLYGLWAPCILYVGFLAIRYSFVSPLSGTLRLLLWATIAVLFIRASLRMRHAAPAHGNNGH